MQLEPNQEVTMKTAFYSLWAFIFLVTLYDIAWFIKYRNVLEDWESNPFVLYLVELGGLTLAIAFRSLSITFIFVLMRYCSIRAKIWATSFASVAHIYLVFIYIVGISDTYNWREVANVFIK